MGTITGRIVDVDNGWNWEASYALTKHGVWRAVDNYAWEWTLVMNTGVGGGFFAGKDLTFLRLKCASSAGRVYVLGVARKALGSTDGTYYLFRTTDNGNSWVYREIATDENIYRKYIAQPYSDIIDNFTARSRVPPEWWTPKHRDVLPLNGSIVAGAYSCTKLNGSDWIQVHYDNNGLHNCAFEPGNCPDDCGHGYVHRNTGGSEVADIYHVYVRGASEACPQELKDFLTESFEVTEEEITFGEYPLEYDVDEARYLGFALRANPDHDAWEVYRYQLVWELVSEEPIAPAALDYGKHNDSIVYVGLETQVWRSTDSGDNWNVYIEDRGAYDIECHKAQDTADEDITFWSHDGRLFRSNGTVLTTHLLDESPLRQPFRIASDPVNGYPIYTLRSLGGDVHALYKINSGGGSEAIVAYMISGRTVRFLLGSTGGEGRRLFYIDLQSSPENTISGKGG